MSTTLRKISDDAVMHGALSRYLCMVEMSPDGTIVHANDNYLHAAGYSLNELVGKNYRLVCTPEFITSKKYSAFWESLRNGHMVKKLIGKLKHDGGIFWLDAQFFPIRDTQGTLITIIMLASDESARTVDSMETQGKWTAIDRSMIVAEYTPDGHIISANENYLSAFALAPDELSTKHVSDLVSESATLDGTFRQLWEYVCSGHTHVAQMEMINAAGEPLWLQSVYAPVFGPGDKIAKVVQFAVDVSWNVQNQQTERDVANDISLIVDKNACGIMIADRQNKVTYINPSFTAMFGYEAKDIKGNSAACVFGPQEHRLLASFRTMLQTEETLRCEEIVYGKTGQRIYAALVANPVFDCQGEHKCTVCTFTDITYTKMSEVLQRKTLAALGYDVGLREVLGLLCQEAERLLPGVMVAITRYVKSASPCPLAGPSLPQCLLQDMSNLVENSAMMAAIHTRQYAVNHRVLGAKLQWSRSYCEEMGIHSAAAHPILSSEGDAIGAVTLLFLHGTAPSAMHEKVAAVVANLCNLTMEINQTREAVRQMTFYDPVTSLPNRGMLAKQGDQIIVSNQIRKEQRPMAVMNVNIDRFKRINDTLGFDAGNVLLDVVGKRLSSRCNNGDIAGRLTGDGFALVIADCTADHAADIARRIQNAVAAPCEIAGEEIIATVSIGIAMYPDNGDDMETLLAKANLALGMARKNAKTNSYGFFTGQHNDNIRLAMSLESQLHRAIQENGLSLHYQPQIHFDDGRVYGAEALARWNHPEIGNVSPAIFIPLAEESGLIEELSDWVIREVARQVGDWRARGIPASHVSLNLSAFNFHDSNLPERMLRYLEAYGLLPDDVVVELTEGVLLDDNPATMKTIQKAHDMGFSLALDDFGTGYSSLSYLRRLPVDTVKLDQSFIRDIGTDETSRKLSHGIIHLCRELGLTMVVEGVESKEQFDLLKSQGYHVLQGYFISRPLTVPDFESWIARNHQSGSMKNILIQS